MTLTFEDATSEANERAAHRMQSAMAATRVSLSWLGVRKTLTPAQKSQAADTFDAEKSYVSAAKKLLDTSHPAFKAVTAVRTQILGYWHSVSLPYPDPGVRLIRQDDIHTFTVQMTTLRNDLDTAVEELNSHYDELRATAQSQLGQLFNLADYPPTLVGWFGVSWEFPSLEPPQYLRQLSPKLFEQESQRMAARFEEAVHLAEQAFIDELAKLVSHLTERLTGDDDGKPKVFRDTAVENLTEFFNRFRHLNIRSNDQLDQLVNQAQSIVRGVSPDQLRANTPLRQQVATQLSVVQSTLDGLLIDRPRRNLLRRRQEPVA